jgi:hypothetical protein
MNIGRRRRNDFQVPDLAVFFHGFTTKDTKSTKGFRGEIRPTFRQMLPFSPMTVMG